MNLLIDSNVILDMVQHREPFFLESKGLFFTVIPETASDFMTVTEKPNTEDLEDGLQQQCAARLKLDYIVTRNIDDFRASAVPAIEPGQFLSKFF